MALQEGLTVKGRIAALDQFDGLGQGVLLARLAAPSGAVERGLGDIVRAPDGTVHVADSVTGELLVLRPGASVLEVLLPAGR